MKARAQRFGAGLVSIALMGLAFACDRGGPPSAPAAAASNGFSASVDAGGSAAHVQWDIVSINFSTGTVSAGGIASALANDGSQITLTGSGSFVAPAGGGGTSRAVTGGGTWATSGAVGGASGTYAVTGLVRWEQAPGTFPPLTDNIGDPADASPGLVVLRIAYSDGSQGTLIVSCHLVGTPDHVFEGVTASKGFVGFWNREAPVAGVDANRTVFHLTR